MLLSSLSKLLTTMTTTIIKEACHYYCATTKLICFRSLRLINNLLHASIHRHKFALCVCVYRMTTTKIKITKKREKQNTHHKKKRRRRRRILLLIKLQYYTLRRSLLRFIQCEQWKQKKINFGLFFTFSLSLSLSLECAQKWFFFYKKLL